MAQKSQDVPCPYTGYSDATVQAMLARLSRDPTDMDARRELSDHLMDNGDPRGELMQIQLELAAADAPSAARRADLEARRDALIKTHGAAWRAPFEALGATDVTFHLGFVRCSVPEEKMIENGKRLAELPYFSGMRAASAANFAPRFQVVLGDAMNRFKAMSAARPIVYDGKPQYRGDEHIGIRIQPWPSNGTPRGIYLEIGLKPRTNSNGNPDYQGTLPDVPIGFYDAQDNLVAVQVTQGGYGVVSPGPPNLEPPFTIRVLGY